MSRATQPQFSALLVEGRSDCGFFRKLTCPRSCRLYDAKKVLARQTAKLATELDVPGIVALVDRDHDHIFERMSTCENLIYTDENDLEITIIKSKAFVGFLHEYLDYDRQSSILAVAGYESLSQFLLDMIGIVGVLRYLSEAKNWGLRFRDLAVETIFDRSKMCIVPELLVKQVHDASPEVRVTKSDAIQELQCKVESVVNISDFATGHDATKLLALLLSSKIWGNYDVSIESLQIERELRLCFTSEFFRSTKMYQGLSTWERNPGQFSILSKDN